VPYTKFHEAWENEPSTDTPITAEALDHIEEGIQDAHDAIDALDPIPTTASDIPIVDAAGDFTATDVEGALAEIQTDTEALDVRLDTLESVLWQIVFPAMANEPPATAYATYDVRNTHPVLDFDAATDESAVFSGILPVSYGSSGLNVRLIWAATSATSGDVVWEVSFERIAATVQDLDSDSFATATTATATADSNSGDTVHTVIAVADGAAMDGVAPTNHFRLKVMRDANHGSDTMAGDAELLMVVVTEQ
jgi:hypothetical protein